MAGGRAMAAHQRGWRGGFTLIELLVVVGIISILVGLTLPAVQQVREAGNRAVCMNNLKQMNLALHMYEGDHKCFPPNRLDNRGATWAVMLEPYLQQHLVYRHWDLEKSYYDQVPLARTTNLPNYFCPSRRDASTSPALSISGDEPNPGMHVPGGLGDYAANIGTTGMDFL
jgi:prepilin-type N-terminal cleavage/methylation domain-containing protein